MSKILRLVLILIVAFLVTTQHTKDSHSAAISLVFDDNDGNKNISQGSRQQIHQNTDKEPAILNGIQEDISGEKQSDFSSRVLQMLILITVLSVAPSIIMMITSFTKIVIVFGFLRNAFGGLQIPPNQVMMALSLFLTFFIMSDTFKTAYNNGIAPVIQGNMKEEDGFIEALKPFEAFMKKNVRKKDLMLFASMRNEKQDPEKMSIYSLVPAFMISEIRKGFEIGFLISVPFLIIDLVVGAILMALGMTTTHPATISLPFKIIYFVLIDGWYMICGSLAKSYIN